MSMQQPAPDGPPDQQWGHPPDEQWGHPPDEQWGHPPDQQWGHPSDEQWSDPQDQMGAEPYLYAEQQPTFDAAEGLDLSSMTAFLASFHNMPIGRAKQMSRAAGVVQFKEELHQKKWRKTCMVVCPTEPVEVDGGVATQALLIYDVGARKERKIIEGGGGPTEVKPLRYCSFEPVQRGQPSLSLPKGIRTGYVVTLSSTIGVPSADEFAFYVDTKQKEAGDATDAQWIEAFQAVQAVAEAVILMQGRLELQGQRLLSNQWIDHHFELRGPVLSYFDAERSRLGSIHFENPNTDVSVHAEDPTMFEVLSPKTLYVLRCGSKEQCNRWVAAMRDVKASIARHSEGGHDAGGHALDRVGAMPQANSLPAQGNALEGTDHDLGMTAPMPASLVRDPMVVEVDKQAIGAEFERWPGCQQEEQYLHVTAIKSFGACASQRVQPGMIVVAINGHDCAYMDEREQQKALKSRPVTLHVGFPDSSDAMDDTVANEAESTEPPLARAKARYGTQWDSMNRAERNQAVRNEAESAVKNEAESAVRNEAESTGPPLARAKARYGTRWDSMSRDEQNQAVIDEVDMEQVVGTLRSDTVMTNDLGDIAASPVTRAKARNKHQWDLMSQDERIRAVEAEAASTRVALSRAMPADVEGQARPRDRPSTVADYLKSRNLDVSKTLQNARPSESTSKILLRDLEVDPPGFGLEDEKRMRGLLTGNPDDKPGFPMYSAATLRQAERIGRPIDVSVHDMKYSGEDLQTAEHTRAGTHSLSKLLGSAQLGHSHTSDDSDHEHSKAVDGFWGGTLDPVARLRAAAQLTDLTTMKDVLFAEERRKALPPEVPQEHVDQEELARASLELTEAIEKLRLKYRRERSLRRQGQPSDPQEEASPPPKARRRVARTDPAAFDDDYDPTAADIAARRRIRQGRKANMSAHVGQASTAAEAVTLGYEAGQARGFQEGGRALATISALDQGQAHDTAINSGDTSQLEPSTPTTQRGSSAAKLQGDPSLLLSDFSTLSLHTAVEMSSSRQSSSGSDVASPGSRWDADAGRRSSRYRAAPSSYSRQTSPRSKTVHARRRAKAEGSIITSEGEGSRIMDDLARQTSPRSQTVHARHLAKAEGSIAASEGEGSRIMDELAPERSSIFARPGAVEQGQSMPIGLADTVDKSFSLDYYRSPLAAVSQGAEGAANAQPVGETQTPRSTMSISRAASLRLRAQAMAQQQSSQSHSPSRSRASTPGN